jgi:hypothetical protein
MKTFFSYAILLLLIISCQKQTTDINNSLEIVFLKEE